MRDSRPIEKKPKDMTIQELRLEAARLQKEGIDPGPLITQINEKIALAFSCFVFMLLGIPLAVITRRRERSINFGMAFLIIGFYYILFMGSTALSLEGNMNPRITMWMPNIIFGTVGIILTYRLCRN
jgi:lipopolysaccharide export LptBFGC system permease protein LptF